MTNTIHNVPRELKPCPFCGGEPNLTTADYVHDDLTPMPVVECKSCSAWVQADDWNTRAPSPADHVEDVRAMVADPSPAGEDGLEVIGWYTDDHLDDKSATTYSREVADRWLAKGWPVTGIANKSDAQAIIDGLRGEVADLRSMLATVSKAGLRVRTERDQHARRIGELEAALEFACKALAQVTSSDGSGHADIAVSVLRMAGTKDADALHVVEDYKAGAKWRIAATLSAGKESAK